MSQTTRVFTLGLLLLGAPLACGDDDNQVCSKAAKANDVCGSSLDQDECEANIDRCTDGDIKTLEKYFGCIADNQACDATGLAACSDESGDLTEDCARDLFQ